MNTFKRKALSCAVLAGLGVAATTAQAVVMSPDNTGTVLVYPYYTVNAAGGNPYNTYLSITNSTSQAKVLKVRFREGKTSAEVLDFNLYLSPNDMWVAAIVPDGQGTNDPARIINAGDLSCTDPPIPSGGQPFLNFGMTGSDALPGATLDRTREGYIEVFEMANLTGQAAIDVTHPATVGTAPPCATSATVAQRIMSYLNNGGIPPGLVGNMTTASGGLYGNVTLINVANGADMGYVANALDRYNNTPGGYYAGVGQQTPFLGASATPPQSLVIAQNGTTKGIAFAETFAGSVSLGTAGAQAVASTMMHTSVLNDYILDTGTASNTDWVLTFPLKREFVNSTTAGAPFTAVMTSLGACEPALFEIFNRDEQSQPITGFSFSPPSGGLPPNVGNLCWESTVLSIRNGVAHTTASGSVSGVLGSRNSLAVSVPQNFQNGWMRLTFTGAGATTTGLASVAGTAMDQTGVLAGLAGARTFVGLPVVGFMARTLTNNAVTCIRGGVSVTGGCQGNYGSSFEHAYVTTVR